MRRLWQLMHPYRARFLLGVAVSVLSWTAALVMPQVLSYLVNEVFTVGAGATVVLMAGLVVVGLALVESGLLYVRRLLTVDPSARIEYRMRTRLFAHLQRMPMAFHDHWESGQLLSRAMTDLGEIRRFVAFGGIMLITDVFTLSIGITMMVNSHPTLALIFFCGAAPIIVYTAWFALRFRKLSREFQDASGDLATNVEQSVHGIRVLKAFGRGRYALDRYTVGANEVRKLAVKRGELIASFDAVVRFLPEAALGVVLLLGLHYIADGSMNVGQLSAFFAVAMILAGPVAMIGQMFAAAASTLSALDRHFEVLDQQRTIANPEHPAAFRAEDARGELELLGVRFAYPDRPDEELLHGVNLKLNPGETMALVGITGAGKSTALQLVPRLYDVTGGAVLIDGHDVRELSLEELRATTAVAFEEATLFSGTVRENVLLGADRALGTARALTESDRNTPEADALLELALNTADAGFAYDLPDGVETRIGEQGLSLSGGQRQRLALARAIAAKPRILLLDDPLSALDTATEERVTARLREVLAGTTTLVVAHRSSTVALADRVALLDNGQVRAVGTHPELMRTHPDYRAIMSDPEAALVEELDAANGGEPQ